MRVMVVSCLVLVLWAGVSHAATSYTYIATSYDDTDGTSTTDTDFDPAMNDGGMIWRNLPMNKGDTINSATLYVYAEESWDTLTENTVGTLRGLRPVAGGYPNFQQQPLAGRSTTAASTTYTWDSTTLVGGSDTCTTLVSIIQEIVNSNSYSNEVGLYMFKAASGPNRAIATEEDPAVNPPRLYINYDPTCLTLAPLANGVVSPSTATVPSGSVVSLSCNTGYLLSGSASRTCYTSGLYSGSSTSCSLDPSFCPSMSVSNAQVTSCTYSLGGSCSATCLGGYVYKSGSLTRTCLLSATWSGSTYTCTNAVCPTLSITHGTVTYESASRIYGTTATFSCNVGYSLSGVTTRTCSQDLGGGVGAWSGSSSPTCDILYCGTLTQPAPLNGNKVCTGTTYGETCTFSCDLGYQLFGDAVRECGPAGSWLGSANALCSTVNATQSLVSAPSAVTLTAGTSWAFDVQTRDNTGQVVATGADVVAVHMANDGGASPLVLGNYSGSSGVYTVDFAVPPLTGVTTYEIRINSELVAPAAHTVTVVASSGVGLTSQATGQGLAVSTVNAVTQIVLVVRDTYGNLRDGTGAADTVEALLQSSSQQVPVDITSRSTSEYLLEYVPSVGGIYSLSLTVNGEQVQGSPWAVVIDSACQPGFQAIDQTSCAECPTATYSTTVNADTCLECPTQRTSPPQSSGPRNCTCLPGFWTGLADVSLDTGETPCVPCPAGASCAGRLSAPQALPGYQGTDTAGVFLSCPVPESCQANGQCATGYQGRLCSDCAANYFKINDKCFRCADGNVFVLPIMVLGAFGVSALLVWLNTRESEMYGWAAFIISMNSAQIVAIYADLTLGWNGLASSIFRVFSVLNFNLDLASPECSVKFGNVFVAKWVMTMLLPMLFAGLFALVYLLTLLFAKFVRQTGEAWAASHPAAFTSPSWIKRRYARLRSQTHITGPYLRAAVARAFVQLLGLFYLPLCATTLRYFDCVEVQDGVYVFSAAPAHRCYTSSYYSLLPLAIFFALLYAAGIPVMVAVLLRKKKASLPWPTMIIRYGFLVARFTDAQYFFEILIMMRKLLVVVAVVAFDAPLTKASAASLVLLVMGFHVTFMAPYRRLFHNGLESLSIMCAFVVLSAQTITHDTTFRDVIVVVFLIALVLVLVGGTAIDAYFLIRAAQAADDDMPGDFVETKTMMVDGPLTEFSVVDTVVYGVPSHAGGASGDLCSLDGVELSPMTANDMSLASISSMGADGTAIGSSTMMSSTTAGATGIVTTNIPLPPPAPDILAATTTS